MSNDQIYIQDRTMPEPNSGCWLWLLSVNKDGYGDSKRGYAHRVSFKAFRGPIPDGLLVCHKCDVPSCCNPDHLFLGTHAQNMADKIAKGRDGSPYGEKHWNAKLTAEQSLAVRNDNRPWKVIMAEYGMSKSNVAQIKSGARWKQR